MNVNKKALTIGGSIFALGITYYMLKRTNKEEVTPVQREVKAPAPAANEKYVKFVDEWEADRRKLSKSRGLSGGKD